MRPRTLALIGLAATVAAALCCIGAVLYAAGTPSTAPAPSWVDTSTPARAYDGPPTRGIIVDPKRGMGGTTRRHAPDAPVRGTR